jgi:CheY-like chemotaxis protein
MTRVLVVEDEMLVAMLIEDQLSDLGYDIVGPAMRLETALELAETAEFDIAILDINLAGRQSFSVADLLASRGLPFLFASGYGAAGLVPPFLDRPVLQKPFNIKMMAEALQELVAPSPIVD